MKASLTQNGKSILSYNGEADMIGGTAETPSHCAVNGKNIRIETGELQMDVELTATNKIAYFGEENMNVDASQGSSPTTFSDEFVSISVAPAVGHPLLGIEYSLCV